MCTTSVYACNYASCWHDVFHSSYLQRFHTHGPYQQNIDVAGFVFDLTDSQVAFWWNSVGSQFAFLNEDLRHKGTDANARALLRVKQNPCTHNMTSYFSIST